MSSAEGAGPRTRPPWLRPFALVLIALLAALTVVLVAIAIPRSLPNPQVQALDTNPVLDPGTVLPGRAPSFTLTDQFGQPVSLRSYRGKVVIVAFNDAECTTVCPLTTTAMVQAKEMLGAAGRNLALVGIDANPQATAVKWVRAYSTVHGMLHQWQFLTSSLPALSKVWHAYHIDVAIEGGQIDHTPAVFVIDQRGDFAKLYETQMAYRSVPQQAQVYADEVSKLLPGHPAVHSHLSYETVAPVSPASRTRLPSPSGASVAMGADGKPRLYVFFASWLTETMSLGADLDSLRNYERIARARGLPRITAVDEGSVEPSPLALPGLLGSLAAPLTFPVAIDDSGRVADGYGVQDQPWFVLASRDGSILWYWDASTQGWPTPPQLLQHVASALASPPHVKPIKPAQIPRLLAGSPAPLAAIHKQGGELLGSVSELLTRIHALRGYPIVVNVWASWCTPCQHEYPFFADAAVRYGRQVAFLGVNALDYGSSYARAFLATHPLSYPSYQSPDDDLDALGGSYGLPTTFFIDRAGHVVKPITGGFDSQGALDGDIAAYALGH